MPETETENKKNVPMVDIDTSGPEVEVNLDENKEDKKVEEPKETIKVEEIKQEEIDAKEETKKEETKKEDAEDKKKELDDYSEGVQKSFFS